MSSVASKACTSLPRIKMASNPLMLVFLPTVYMLGACFSLLQFQVVLALLAKGVASAKKIEALQPVLPRG